MQKKDITIALTSCWRIKSLKKTIESLKLTIDIHNYQKILTEDSKDIQHIGKIEYENKSGFLKWWKILYTGNSSRKSLYHSHYNALLKLYATVDTKYVFHCEDDQVFKKVTTMLV